MGSEGYLINEFIVAHTNQRDDEWGGSYENRIRFAVGDRAPYARARGPRLHHHLPACRCSTWSRAAPRLEEVVQLAQAIEAAGATLINTGIGWHEARIPTIAT